MEELKASDLDALEKIAKAADDGPDGVIFDNTFDPLTVTALIALARRSLPSPEAGGREVAKAKEVAFRKLYAAWEAWDIPDDTPVNMIGAMELAAQLFFADPGFKQKGAAAATLAAPRP